jgi:hypothetical protein
MRINSRFIIVLHRSCVVVAAALLLASCASSPELPTNSDARVSRADSCRAGDRVVESESSCLTGDASCYALANGDWCTGTLEPRCPAGSSPVPAGYSCPGGARCFQFSESLNCQVDT